MVVVVVKLGRCSQEDFVRAVDNMQLKGTSVLFRTIRSPIKCPQAERHVLLERTPTPQKPPDRAPATVPTARVANKQVAFDVEQKRYSVSPHGKDHEKKVQQGAVAGIEKSLTPPT